jgi:hypothetical protein
VAGNDIFLRSVPSDADQDDIRLYDPTVADTGGTINATANQTLDNVTQAATAQVIISATASQTIEAVTQSVNADLLVQATASQTLDNITQSASADLLVQAAASQTIDAITQSVNADLLVQAIAAQTIDAVTQSASADILINATASQTLDAVTQTATSTLSGGTINATANQLIEAVTQNSTATISQPQTVTISGGGSYTWAKNRLFKRPDEEDQPEKIPLEIVKIGKADSQIITGLVVPKAKPKQTRPAVLEKLAAAEFNAARLRGEQLKRLQMADDEWLMTA